MMTLWPKMHRQTIGGCPDCTLIAQFNSRFAYAKCDDGRVNHSVPPPYGVPGGTPEHRWTPPVPVSTRPPLRRATSGSADMPAPWLGGVCSGLSVHLGVSIHAVRLVTVLLSLLAGAGAILYLWLFLMVPKDDSRTEHSPSGRLSRSLSRQIQDPQTAARNQLFFAGLSAIFVASILVVLVNQSAINISDVIPAMSITLGLGLVWSQATRLRERRTPTLIAFVVMGVVFLLFGLILLLLKRDSPAALLRGGMIGVVIVVVVLIALAPLWLRLFADLSATQERIVRDAERADIAAHLHDSVLQTLTLIRGAAQDPARVTALALTQERELRSWLYTGTEEPSHSLAESLRQAVGQVEATYGVAVNVVTVSDTVPGPGEQALVAAAGEAVTNAVRHGAPPVSVYAEVLPDIVEIFIKDTGPGFDLDSVPQDRHGVRHSIIGRVERAGGLARIRMLASGTEVHLSVPRTQSNAPSTPPPPPHFHPAPPTSADPHMWTPPPSAAPPSSMSVRAAATDTTPC